MMENVISYIAGFLLFVTLLWVAVCYICWRRACERRRQTSYVRSQIRAQVVLGWSPELEESRWRRRLLIGTIMLPIIVVMTIFWLDR